MKGFPKVIKTKSDLVNTFKMAKKGSLKKSDWLEAVAKLENQNWIMCPVINLSEDRKAVTIMFCAEAAAGQRVKNGAVYPTIQSVETVEVDIGTMEIGIPVAVTFYDRMGISREEVEEMKGELEA